MTLNTSSSSPPDPNTGRYGTPDPDLRRRLTGHRQASQRRLEETVGKPPPPGSVPRHPRKPGEPLRGGGQ